MSKGINIPIRSKETDISTEVARGRHFENFLKENSEVIANRVGEGDNLNEEIAQLAKRESLNRLQIQRFVEEVNTLSFNIRYKTKSNERDRRVAFELADTEKILNYMGDDAPGEVDNPNFPNGFIEPVSNTTTSFNKVASENFGFGNGEKRISRDSRIAELEALKKKASVAGQEYKALIGKIGNVLIQNEYHLKNANVLFNTLVDDAGLNKKASSDIINSVQNGTAYLKSAKRLPKDFEVDLSVSPLEKSASSLFGNHSLLGDLPSNAYEVPEVHPHEYASNYEELSKFAKVLTECQKTITNYMEVV